MNLKKFNLILLLFLLNNFYSTIPNSSINPDDLETIQKTIKEGFDKSNKSIPRLLLTTIIKGITKTTTNKILNYIVEMIQDVKDQNSTRVNIEDLDASAVELIFPLDVEIAFKNYEESIIRLLKADKPPYHLLVAGPAGTGKTTGMTRIAKSIKKEFPSAKIYFFEGGKIFAKGAVEAVNILSKNIDNWKEEAKNCLVIIILDEAEVLFPNRDLAGAEKNDLVTLFLSFTGNLKHNILMMVSTNHPDSMDPAIRRRFTILINVRSPTEEQIIKMIQSYINLYNKQSDYDITETLDLQNSADKLFFMSQYLISMSGADVDNMIKKAADSAKSDLGFLHWGLLYEKMREEIIKKATFSKKITEEKKEEIKRILFSDRTYNIFDYCVPYVILTSCNISYEKFVLNSFYDLFFGLNKPLNEDFFLALCYNQLLTNKATSISNIFAVQSIQNNNYINRKYFSNQSNITPLFIEEYCRKNATLNVSIDQSITPVVPETGEYLEKLNKDKYKINTLSTQSQSDQKKIKIKNLHLIILNI